MKRNAIEHQGNDADPTPCTYGDRVSHSGSTAGADIRGLVIRQLMEGGCRLTVSLPEAARLLGISKDMIYRVASRDDFPTLALGGRKVISLIGLVDWVERQTDAKQRGCS